MVDAIGVSASIVGLVGLSARTFERIVDLQYKTATKPEWLEETSQELQIYGDILRSIGRDLVNSRTTPPDIAEPCTRLCYTRLRRVEHLLDRWATNTLKPSPELLKSVLSDFTSSVRIFRDVATDTFTHDRLNSLEARQTEFETSLCNWKSDFEVLLCCSENSAGADGNEAQANPSGPNERNDGYNKSKVFSRAKSRAMFGDTQTFEDSMNAARQPSADFGSSIQRQDPFILSVTIMRAHEGESEPMVGRATLDSGCEDNWVSLDIIHRGRLHEQTQSVDSRDCYVAFGGDHFCPLGLIDLTWYAWNASKSRKTTFFVHDHVPFDLVLGKRFILEESVFVLDKPALALRHAKITREEHRIIEERARQKGATSEQVSQIRRAGDANAREMRRQQKAASRMNTPLAAQSTANLSSINRVGFALSRSTTQGPSSSDTITSEDGGNMSSRETRREGEGVGVQNGDSSADGTRSGTEIGS